MSSSICMPPHVCDCLIQEIPCEKPRTVSAISLAKKLGFGSLTLSRNLSTHELSFVTYGQGEQ